VDIPSQILLILRLWPIGKASPRRLFEVQHGRDTRPRVMVGFQRVVGRRATISSRTRGDFDGTVLKHNPCIEGRQTARSPIQPQHQRVCDWSVRGERNNQNMRFP
jgi:hypothetical protein